jgi:hypothetical protein
MNLKTTSLPLKEQKVASIILVTSPFLQIASIASYHNPSYCILSFCLLRSIISHPTSREYKQREGRKRTFGVPFPNPILDSLEASMKETRNRQKEIEELGFFRWSQKEKKNIVKGNICYTKKAGCC